MGAAAIAAIGWTATATATLVVTLLAADNAETRTEVLRTAYETRLSELTAELEGAEAAAAETESRFSLAIDTLARSQDELLAAAAEARELELGLEAMRAKLQVAIDERESLIAENTDLIAELERVATALYATAGTEEDTGATLEAVSAALARTTRNRDEAIAAVTELQTELTTLDLRMRVRQEQQEQLFRELEEMVNITLTPLERLLNQAGLDVDVVVGEMRRQYSGSGGPFLPVTEASLGDAESAARVTELMENLDRVNLMRIAADQLPLSMPVLSSYRFTSGFGVRRDPRNGRARQHNGIDLAGPHGTPLYATAEGEVIFAGRMSGYGLVTKVRHAFGFETLYAHQSRIRVSVGDRVARGDHIGDMGNTGRSTGTHLHYEIRVGGTPVNPMTYVRAAEDVL